MLGGLLDVSGSFSEGKPDLSRLSNQLMCHTCRRWCAVPRHRTKHLEGPAGRAQIGGHDDLSFMTSAPQHHAFWHFPPRRARSLKARANHATHPTPRAWESIGYVICICGYNHVTFNENMRVVVFVFVDLSWRRWLCAKKTRRGTAPGTAIDKKNDRRSTREGGRRGRAGAMRVVAAVRTFGLCVLEFRLSHHCTEGLDRAPAPLPSLLSPARRPSPWRWQTQHNTREKQSLA